MDRTLTISKHDIVVDKYEWEELSKEVKELRKIKKYINSNLISDTLKPKLTKARRRKVTIMDLEESLVKQNRQIFSLISPAGEVNAYMLTFEQALDMVNPAIDIDGFTGSELEIRIIK